MGCKCSEDGYIHLCATSRGDVDLNLRDKQIEIDDAFLRETKVLLKVNYCPICGQKLGEDNMKGIITTQGFDTSYFVKGQAYVLEFTKTNKSIVGLLESSETNQLKFATISNNRAYFMGIASIYVRPKDIPDVKMTKLVPEED